MEDYPEIIPFTPSYHDYGALGTSPLTSCLLPRMTEPFKN